MKKIAGTLKLDQAQYRELEAFSKFGSELDQSTMRVLDKGRKNMELLKQDQYSPMKIEHQVAIIYCGVNELLRGVPVDKIKEFEKDFINLMELEYKNILNTLREGTLTEKEEKSIIKAAGLTAEKFFK